MSLSTFATHQTVAHSRQGGILSGLMQALDLYRSRARLAQLDAHLLADIGLNRAAAEAEARRPIWDLSHRPQG